MEAALGIEAPEFLKIEVAGMRVRRCEGLTSEIAADPLAVTKVDDYPAGFIGTEIRIERGPVSEALIMSGQLP